MIDLLKPQVGSFPPIEPADIDEQKLLNLIYAYESIDDDSRGHHESVHRHKDALISVKQELKNRENDLRRDGRKAELDHDRVSVELRRQLAAHEQRLEAANTKRRNNAQQRQDHRSRLDAITKQLRKHNVQMNCLKDKNYD